MVNIYMHDLYSSIQVPLVIDLEIIFITRDRRFALRNRLALYGIKLNVHRRGSSYPI